MAASTQVEFPFHTGIARQRGRGFGGLAQVIGELKFFFFSLEYIVPAAKRVGADLFELAVPEIGDVVSGGKNFKLQRVWEDKLCENNWALASVKESEAESFHWNLQNKPVSRHETFSQTLLLNHVE